MTDLQRLLSSISRGDMHRALLQAGAWLARARPGDTVAALRAAQGQDRTRLALVFRDILAKYPNTLLGAPILLQYRSPRPVVTLPVPHPHFRWPSAHLEFLRWLPLTAEAPVDLVLPARPLQVPTQQTVSAVALFRASPDVFDQNELVLPNTWWDTVFEVADPHAESVTMAVQLLLPYPDALEAGRVLLATATGSEPPQGGGFLSDLGWQWALQAGRLFRESQRHATEI